MHKRMPYLSEVIPFYVQGAVHGDRVVTPGFVCWEIRHLDLCRRTGKVGNGDFDGI